MNPVLRSVPRWGVTQSPQHDDAGPSSGPASSGWYQIRRSGRRSRLTRHRALEAAVGRERGRPARVDRRDGLAGTRGASARTGAAARDKRGTHGEEQDDSLLHVVYTKGVIGT